MRITSLILFLIAFTQSGCASNSSQVGVRVGDTTLNQFVAGTTTEAWLIAILGPPTTIREVEGIPNTRVYRYVARDSNTGLATLFSGQGSRDTAVVYFIATDGIITRFWADRTEPAIVVPPAPADPDLKAEKDTDAPDVERAKAKAVEAVADPVK
jgi:hypothetical protein